MKALLCVADLVLADFATDCWKVDFLFFFFFFSEEKNWKESSNPFDRYVLYHRKETREVELIQSQNFRSRWNDYMHDRCKQRDRSFSVREIYL